MKKLLLLLFTIFVASSSMMSQRVVYGTVTDDTGEALIGASVVVKENTNIGTITDIDGNYKLKIGTEAKTLVFSYIGYTNKEVAIGDSDEISVMLTSGVQLENVVVTALGVTREKKSLGYSVQDVSGEDIVKAGATDMVNALAAKTAGLQVISSGGTAGASTYATIRGAASISGNNQPLYVVDGVPVETGQSSGGGRATDGVNASSRSIDFNPEDIESVSVLKGGAATALYGVRAANGVILITTKKGKLGQKVQIQVHSSVTSSQLSQRIALQNKYGQGINGKWKSGYSGTWGPRLDTVRYSKEASPLDKYNTKGSIVGQSDPNAGAPVQTFDQYGFFQRGLSFNNNISVSAGSDKNTYFFSLGNLNEEGIIPNNTFDRTTIRLNASSKLTDKITTGGNTMFSVSKGNFAQNGSNVAGIMLGLLRTPSTFDNSDGWIFEDGTQRTYRHGGGYNNPYWSANVNKFTDKINRFVGNAYIKYDIFDWMNLTYDIGTDWYVRRFQDVFEVNDRAYPDGRLQENSSFNQSINGNLMLSMKTHFTDDIGVNFLLGHNMYANNARTVVGVANGLSIPGLYTLSNTSDAQTSKGELSYRTSALYADASFDFYDMLYLGAALRNEWSTTMPKDNLSALYPSFSLGFVFSELDVFKNSSFFSYGKLRTSWAKTANIAGAYSTVTYFNPTEIGDGFTNGVAFPFRESSGYEVGWLLGNTDLKHENQTTFEVGAELKFFDNRFGIDAAYFHNNNTDILLAIPIAASTGYNNLYANAASLESKGVEVSAYATPIKTKNFDWTINANFSKMSNKVLELAKGVDNVFLGGFVDPQVRAVKGYDYGTIFGFDWTRDDQGRILINDDPTDDIRDGFPWTDQSKQVALGSISPDWTANITNTLSYKGITLSALLDIKSGGLMYNGTRFTLNFFGQTEETLNRDVVYNADGTINYEKTPKENLVVIDGVYGHIDGDGNVVSSGEENVTQVVLDQEWFRGHGGNFGGGPTAAAIEDASWVRLREITLSYDMSSLINSKYISRLELYLTGRNLYLDTPYTGIDPETSLTQARNSQGFDYFNNPGSKSFTFGAKFTF